MNTRHLVLFAALTWLSCGGSEADIGGDVADDSAEVIAGELSAGVPVGSTLVTTGGLNLRAGPASTFSILKVMPAGARVTVLRSTPTTGFYNVRSGSTEGWASGNYLQLESSGAGGSGGAGGGSVTGRELFVSTTGSDSNSGTSASPFRTIAKAVSAAGSSTATTITVRGGTYGQRVVISGSGSSSAAQLTVRSAPGETAIIDGSSLSVGEAQGLVEISSRSNVRVEGLEIRNFKSTSANNVPAGILVKGTADNVSLISNHVHHIVTTAEATGNAFGIQIYGTGALTRITVRDCEVDHLKTGSSESVTFNGNVDGFVAEANRVHDNDNIGIDVIGFEGTAASADQARNGVIRGNEVWNITSRNNPAYHGETAADGIYVDGGKNVLIERNVVRTSDLGIEIASEHAGRASSYVLVRSNVVTGSPQAGISVGGYAANVGSTDHTLVLNNTLSANAVEFQAQFHISSTIFQNNLVQNAGGNFTNGSSAGITRVSNVQRTSATFVSSTNLRPAASVASVVVDQGTMLTACPSGWSCPAVWGSNPQGASDVAGNPRMNGRVDVGAYEN